MAELLNWPPSRGANPHEHRWTWTPNVTRKDMPAPKEQPIATAEKGLMEDIKQGKFRMPAMKVVHRRIKREKKPLLAGSWRVWCQVEDVAGLTVQQADALILACPENPGPRGEDHMDNWFGYEPRPLWVDITYPLKRGVRLCVKPAVREAGVCKACEASFGKAFGGRKSAMMSPGYLLWTVAKEYVRIYQEHEKYGVWGHGLSDLGFERITVRKDGVVDLGIGS